MTRSRSKTHTRRFRTFSLCGVLIVCLMGVFFFPQQASAAENFTYKVEIPINGSVWLQDHQNTVFYPEAGGKFEVVWWEESSSFFLNYYVYASDVLPSYYLNVPYYKLQGLNVSYKISVQNQPFFDVPDVMISEPVFRFDRGLGVATSSWFQYYTGEIYETDLYPISVIYSQPSEALYTSDYTQLVNRPYMVGFTYTIPGNDLVLEDEGIQMNVGAFECGSSSGDYIPLEFTVDSITLEFLFSDTRIQDELKNIRNELILSDQELSTSIFDKIEENDTLVDQNESFDQSWFESIGSLLDFDDHVSDIFSFLPSFDSQLGSGFFKDLFSFCVGTSSAIGTGDFSFLVRPFIVCGLLMSFISFLLRR